MPARMVDGAVLSLRVDLPGGRIGPGKVALLEAIAREGSIAAAGRCFGMSYRRAWRLVEQLGAVAGGKVVAARPGGPGGGTARLTQAGERLVAEYRALEAAARAAAAPHLSRLGNPPQG